MRGRQRVEREPAPADDRDGDRARHDAEGRAGDEVGQRGAERNWTERAARRLVCRPRPHGRGRVNRVIFGRDSRVSSGQDRHCDARCSRSLRPCAREQASDGHDTLAAQQVRAEEPERKQAVVPHCALRGDAEADAGKGHRHRKCAYEAVSPHEADHDRDSGEDEGDARPRGGVTRGVQCGRAGEEREQGLEEMPVLLVVHAVRVGEVGPERQYPEGGDGDTGDADGSHVA